MRSSNMRSSDPSKLFSFSVISDVQYVDAKPGRNYLKTRKRDYRNSLLICKKAGDTARLENVSFALQLGDIIDRKNANAKKSSKAINEVLSSFKNIKLYSVVGNHDLYNFSLNELSQKLKIPFNGYYHFSPFPGFRFVVLNTYDFSVINPKTKDAAYKYLAKYNMNNLDNKNSWFVGLKGLNRRFVPYNGALSHDQINWFQNILDYSDNENEKVIVLSHQPIHPKSCENSALIWNYRKILDMMIDTNCVIAHFAGHDHSGGLKYDNGILFKTFNSPLEVESDETSWSVVDIYADKMIIRDKGINIDGNVFEKTNIYPIV